MISTLRQLTQFQRYRFSYQDNQSRYSYNLSVNAFGNESDLKDGKWVTDVVGPYAYAKVAFNFFKT